MRVNANDDLLVNVHICVQHANVLLCLTTFS